MNCKKTALVTGASRGIGAAIADKLASEGYDLFLTCSNSLEDLTNIASAIKEKYNIECEFKKCDAGDPAQVKALFEEDFFKEKGLDVLVNNAGISYVGLLHEMADEDWERVISVNLGSVFYHSKYAVSIMLKKHSGKIINISSVWGSAGASTEVAYSASKGGVEAFTRSLAKELAPSGICVNALACGLIDTKMNSCFSKEDLCGVIEEIPCDRIGTAEEVAQAVYKLIEMPDYLTGQIVKIDGGWI
ncbi:MAG: SDR family NAD(P)-dependent oxidoreductase [Lachnospiraceae bacterium]|nr:SDR family NAD(P)-dependent oxidoreductase [Lachnospiraceae bacterium]